MSGNSHDLRYLALAREQAADSDCVRRQVGAVIVKQGSLIVAAANGTPPGCIPCNEGGCPRCQSDILSGQAYDSCICIHAEQRAIALAAAAGSSTVGATMYVTLRPCIPCLNLCFHAGILDVVYDEELTFGQKVEEAHAQFVDKTNVRLRRVDDSRA